LTRPHTPSSHEPDHDCGLAEARAIAATCNHFGFCTSTCPTYALTHDENESPRGRIDLIRAMLSSEAPPPARTVKHLDTCLSCLACVSVCAVKVDYMHLIDHARTHIERRFRRPLSDRALRFFVGRVISNRRLFRAALAVGRHAVRLRRFAPRRFRPLLDLIPSASHSDHEDVVYGTYEAQGTKRYRVALLAGCAQRVLAPQINAATVRLLTREGCDVVVARGVECCGSLELHMGRTARGRASAIRSIDAWIAEMERYGLDAIVVNASGCGTAMKDYGHQFRSSGYEARARRVESITVDISEFLARIGLQSQATPHRYKVAYHDACSLRNGQRVTRQPRDLLRAAGYTVIDVPEAHFCCGSAGTYNLLQPKNARALGERKARHVQSTGAPVLAVGNIGCLTQLSRYTTLPTVHTVELLDWATGGPMPPSMIGLNPEPESEPPQLALSHVPQPQPASDELGVW
jgi:glycolate oxidase iron-sulfur subunit